jgi:arginine/serine-rich splicing factor 16
VDILQYVDDLTDKDKQALNEMSGKYGIKSYARLLRVAKKDRDEELRSLKRRQEEGKPKEGTRNSRRRSNERRRRRRRRGRDYDQDDENRYRRRYSPTYEPYGQGSDGSGSSISEDEEDDDMHKNDTSDFVIEFGSNAPDENMSKSQQEHEHDAKQK